MKDYLSEEGFSEIRSPRETIKKAFEVELVRDGNSWLLALEDRNRSIHAYDEEMADEIYAAIRNKYFPLLQELRNSLIKKV